jgi:hypothetical protein
MNFETADPKQKEVISKKTEQAVLELVQSVFKGK